MLFQFGSDYRAAFEAANTQDGLNVCNGNQIDDSRACENVSCPVFETCARVPLRLGQLSKAA